MPEPADTPGTSPLYAVSRFGVARPRATIVIGVLFVALAALGLGRLEIRTDGESLVPIDSPQVRYGREISRDFGLFDQFVLLIRAHEAAGIFSTATLETIARLTREIQALPGVVPEDVISLATERGDRVVPGTLTARSFLDPVPTTDLDLLTLRDDLRLIGLYHGTLVGRGEQTAAVFVGVREGVDRAGLNARIRALINTSFPDERISMVGGAVAEALLGAHIMDDLGVPRWITGSRFTRGATVDRNGNAEDGGRSLLSRARTLIARTIGLLPLAIAVMALVLFAFFRRVTAVLLTMSEVGACLVFVFGCMGIAGVPIYLTIAVMPVILTAVGIADEIHIFTRYRAIANEREHTHEDTESLQARREMVLETLHVMTRPVVQTSLTTAIGFLSFALSPIGAVRAFGVFTAAGVLFCMAWSLAVIPACLALIPTRRLVAPGRRSTGALGGPLASMTAMMWRGRFAIIGVAMVAALLAPLGIMRIDVQDSWLDGFARDSAFARDTGTFNEHYLGSHLLQVTVETGRAALITTVAPSALRLDGIVLPPDVAAALPDPDAVVGMWAEVRAEGPDDTADRPRLSVVTRIEQVERTGEEIMLRTDRRTPPSFAGARNATRVHLVIGPRRLADPDVLARLCGLETFIAGRTGDAVGGVLGPCAYLTASNFLLSGRRETFRAIPADEQRANLVWRHFARVRGVPRRRNLVDDGLDRGIVTVYLTDANFRDTKRLLAAIRAYEREHLAPAGIRLDFAGDVAESQTLIAAIVSTQVRSLLLSLVGIFIVTTLLGRSLLWGLCCVLPCAGAVLMTFAAMGVLGIPLGVATSMFAGMTLGIGVDYAIHLMERYRASRDGGAPNYEAICTAFSTTGPAVLIDALAIAVGFGVLTFSQVPANVRLGGLLALSVAACCVVTLVVLPALLSVIGGRDAPKQEVDQHGLHPVHR